MNKIPSDIEISNFSILGWVQVLQEVKIFLHVEGHIDGRGSEVIIIPGIAHLRN